MMRHAGRQRHGLRARALIAVLWRGGLRISEALALNETDVDPRRGSLLIRHGKGDRRREVGMDPFGFEQLAAWTARRTLLPPGPLFCVIEAPPRSALVGQRRALRAPPARARRRSQTPLRATPATPCPRRRARARRRRGQHHPTPARAYRPRYHRDLPAGHRPKRDHRHRPLTPTTHHLRDRQPHPLTIWPLPDSRGRFRPNAAGKIEREKEALSAARRAAPPWESSSEVFAAVSATEQRCRPSGFRAGRVFRTEPNGIERSTEGRGDPGPGELP